MNTETLTPIYYHARCPGVQSGESFVRVLLWATDTCPLCGACPTGPGGTGGPGANETILYGYGAEKIDPAADDRRPAFEFIN